MTILEGPAFWLSRFSRTRKSLYWLTLSFSVAVFALAFAAALLRDAVAPALTWLPQLVGFFAPGLPANLVEIAMMYPVPGIILIVVAFLGSRMRRRIRIEEEECAFRAWDWTRASPDTCQPQIWAPSWSARVISRLSPAFLLIAGTLSIAALTVVVTTVAIALCPGISTATSSGPDAGCPAEEGPPGCVGAGPRLLLPGQTAHLVVSAIRKRNETGLLLVRGRTYTAQYLRSKGWKDGGLDANAWGVEFEGLQGILARWVGWLRPYPAGGWFQVVGRIDRERRTFPVLSDQENCGNQPSNFTAPADGELVLLVNDVWYANNGGFMTLEIRAQDGPPEGDDPVVVGKGCPGSIVNGSLNPEPPGPDGF